jgi:hypothetical protein
MDDELVVFAELIDAENGNDVLQLTVTLQRLLDAAGDFIVPFANVLRIENPAGRGERIDGGIIPFSEIRRSR